MVEWSNRRIVESDSVERDVHVPESVDRLRELDRRAAVEQDLVGAAKDPLQIVLDGLEVQVCRCLRGSRGRSRLSLHCTCTCGRARTTRACTQRDLYGCAHLLEGDELARSRGGDLLVLLR